MSRLYAQSSFDSLPPQARDGVRASVATSSTVRSTVDEFFQGSAAVRQAGALRDFGNKPLVVLTAGAGSSATWDAAQVRLAALSSSSVHRAQSITDVVTSIRTARPLTR